MDKYESNVGHLPQYTSKMAMLTEQVANRVHTVEITTRREWSRARTSLKRGHRDLSCRCISKGINWIEHLRWPIIYLTLQRDFQNRPTKISNDAEQGKEPSRLDSHSDLCDDSSDGEDQEARVNLEFAI
jgi:hypothetical protein